MNREQNRRDALAQKLVTMDTCVCSMRLFANALERALACLREVNEKTFIDPVRLPHLAAKMNRIEIHVEEAGKMIKNLEIDAFLLKEGNLHE